MMMIMIMIMIVIMIMIIGRRGRARRARPSRRPGGPGPCRRARHGVQPALVPAPPLSPACWGFWTLVSHALPLLTTDLQAIL